jgi:hypothetical protein
LKGPDIAATREEKLLALLLAENRTDTASMLAMTLTAPSVAVLFLLADIAR